jgi:hypothetical protein
LKARGLLLSLEDHLVLLLLIKALSHFLLTILVLALGRLEFATTLVFESFTAQPRQI